MIKPGLPPLSIAWSIWLMGAGIYFLSFFHRVAPNVMSDVLMRDLSITALAFSQISSFYYYAYVAMQIPTGLFADRWGARNILLIGGVLSALGTILLFMAERIELIYLARALIGGGTGVAYVACLKVAQHWLPAQQFSISSGMALIIGILGAMCAGPPLAAAIEVIAWRDVFLYLFVLNVVIVVVMYFWLKNYPSEYGFVDYIPPSVPAESPRLFALIKAALRVRNVRLMFLVPGGIIGAVLSFCGLWGVSYLKARYGIERVQAGYYTTGLLIAFAIGGPLLSYFAEKHQARKRVLFVVFILAIVLACPAFALALPLWLFMVLLLLSCILAGGVVIGFAVMKESVPDYLAGTATSIYNTGIIIGVMILQPVMGYILDAYWLGEHSVAGIRLYPVAAYHVAYVPALLWAFVSLVLLFQVNDQGVNQSRNLT